MNNEYESKNMTIKDLKKVIKNLPDDMDVIIPVYEEGDEDCPYEHRLVRIAGVVQNCVNDRAFVLQTAQNDSITLKDTLLRADVICIEELYPNHYPQLVTLRDYKNAGMFDVMINGFNVYDNELTDSNDEDLLLTHSLFGCEPFLDCRVIILAPDLYDAHTPAFWLDTSEMRKKADIADSRFINIIENERNKTTKDSNIECYIKATGYTTNKTVKDFIESGFIKKGMVLISIRGFRVGDSKQFIYYKDCKVLGIDGRKVYIY